jgi:hypothetical protein
VGKEHLFIVHGVYISSATVEISMALNEKLKIEFPNDPVMLLLGIYPEKPNLAYYKDTPIFIATLFIIAKF